MATASGDRRNERAAPGRLALWTGIVVGPLLWSLHELVSYTVSSNVCESTHPGARLAGIPAADAVTLLASLIALPLTALVLARTLRGSRRLGAPLAPARASGPLGSSSSGSGTSSAGTASTVDERSAFMLHFGAALGVLSLIGLVFSAVAGFLLRCGWS